MDESALGLSVPCSEGERRSSLADRRPQFASNEGTPLPLLDAMDPAQKYASSDVTSTAPQSVRREAQCESESSVSLPGSISRRTAKGIRTVGSVLGRSLFAIDDLRERYFSSVVGCDLAFEVTQCDFLAWFRKEREMENEWSPPEKGASAAPHLDTQPLAPLRARLSTMTHDNLVDHCLRLHALIQVATSVGRIGDASPPSLLSPSPRHMTRRGESSAVRFANRLEPPDGDGRPPTQCADDNGVTRRANNTDASPPLQSEESAGFHSLQCQVSLGGTVSGGEGQTTSIPFASAGGATSHAMYSRSASQYPETPAHHLQHSMSTMSMVSDPVRLTNEARKSIDEDGSKMINDYVVLDELGKGSCGKVKLAFDTDQCRMVAIKIVRKPRFGGDVGVLRSSLEQQEAVETKRKSIGISQQEAQFQSLQREIAVMKKLRHKNIVSLYEVIDDPEAEKLYLVMQYIDNGPIGKVSHDFRCTRIASDDLLPLVSNVLAGLQYLHARNIIHRDIKPENILVSKDGDAFLADFGVSEMFDREEHGSTVEGHRGTRLFLAPELLSNGTAEKGKAVDMWALGVTIYGLLTGHLPFTTTDEIMVGAKPSFEGIPEDWLPIVTSLLNRIPSKRCSAFRTRQKIKDIMTAKAEQLEEDDNDELPDDAHRKATLLPSTSNAVVPESIDVYNAITPMAHKATLLSNVDSGSALHKSSPPSHGGSSHLLSPYSSYKPNAHSSDSVTHALPQFSTNPSVTITMSNPAVLAAPVSHDERSSDAQFDKSPNRQQQRPTVSGMLNTHFKLHNAVVVDLNELDGGSQKPSSKKHMASGAHLSPPPSQRPALHHLNVAIELEKLSLSSQGLRGNVDAVMHINADAQMASSKFRNRLQELVEEQREVETERRLIPQSIKQTFASYTS